MRDFNAEFQEYVDTFPMEGTTAPIAASKIVEHLRREDPKLLSGWLESNAEQVVARYLADRNRSVKAHVASQAAARESAETDNPAPEEGLGVRPQIEYQPCRLSSGGQ